MIRPQAFYWAFKDLSWRSQVVLTTAANTSPGILFRINGGILVWQHDMNCGNAYEFSGGLKVYFFFWDCDDDDVVTDDGNFVVPILCNMHPILWIFRSTQLEKNCDNYFFFLPHIVRSGRLITSIGGLISSRLTTPITVCLTTTLCGKNLSFSLAICLNCPL